MLPDLRGRGHLRLAVRDRRLRDPPRLRRRHGAGARCASGSRGASSSCCSTSSPTTPRPITPGCTTHPEYYIHGSEDDLARAAAELRAGEDRRGKTLILAYGRDPYFDGWPDTFQLNYRHAGFREARIAELGSIAERCDGVRCDMAMLLQPEIIQRTWGDRSRPADGSPPKDNPFWPEAIAAIKRRHPEFMFVAEVYWDMEWELQQAGFDYTYDKRLYDRLVAQVGHAGARAPDGRPGVSGSLAALPREPRRAAGGRDLPAAGAQGGRRGRAARARAALHLRRAARGTQGSRLDAPRAPPGRARRPGAARLLPALARVPAGGPRSTRASGASRPAGRPGRATQRTSSSSCRRGRRASGGCSSVVNYGGAQGQCYVTLGMPGLAGRSFDAPRSPERRRLPARGRRSRRQRPLSRSAPLGAPRVRAPRSPT